MKTVFIATDFSTASHNASTYGVELASALGAKIILFNAYTIPLSIPESYVIVNPEDVKKTAEDYLLEEVLSLRKSSVQPIEIIAAEGPATDTILAHAKQFENCIIVAGMKGEGGIIKRTFGSTVTGLVRKSNMPVIVVPEAASFKSIENIAIATEKDMQSEMQSFEWLKDIGNTFKSKVYIIKVLKSKSSIVDELTHRSQRLFNLLKPLDVEYKFCMLTPATRSASSSRIASIFPSARSFWESSNALFKAAFASKASFLEMITVRLFFVPKATSPSAK